MFIDDTTTLEFNGTDLTQYVTLEAVRFPVLAPVRNDWIENISNRFGRVHRRARPGLTPIEVDVRIWAKPSSAPASTVADIVSQLASVLSTDEPKTLVIGTRYYNAILDGETNLQEFFDLNASVTLRFVTGEGTWHGTKITQILTAGSNVTALGSTADTPAVIKLTASGAVSTVKAKIGTDEITIKRETGTWSNGTVFTIDTEDGMVLINSIDGRKYLTLDSRFGLLKPGNNTVVLTGGGGSIDYCPRWK